MKTYSLLLVMLVLGISIHTKAQSVGVKPVKTGNEWRMPSDAIPRSQQFADRLASMLNLDDATKQKVFAAYLANTKAVDEIRISEKNEKSLKSALQANQTAFLGKLKDILTPTQYDKFVKTEIDSKGKNKE